MENKDKITVQRFDTVDKLLTLITSLYGIMMLMPFIVPMVTDDLALVAILSEIRPDPQFFNIWLLLIGVLTGKQIQK